MKFYQLRQDEITDGTAFRTVDVLASNEGDARIIATRYAEDKDDASARLWGAATLQRTDDDNADGDASSGVTLVAFSDTGA